MDHAIRMIAIETSGRHGSVATLLGNGDQARLVGQLALSGDQRTAQALAPALSDLLTETGWSPKSVDLVAVAVGPGSFTGLRIGVTTAKTFAFAVGAEAEAVNTLEALAFQAPPSTAPLWTILDAQRQEVFVAKFAPNTNGILIAADETTIMSQDAWLTRLQPGDRVIGTALRGLAPRLPNGVEMMPPQLWQPMAAAVGQVAWQAYRAGRRDDLWKLVPQYYRLSAAEEKKR